ncbi:MAG: protein kinase [Ruminococcus sp.]|nr:protein kinase [Ruminococcus sp.]
MKNYCYHCMNELPDGGVCPDCGADHAAEEVVYRLRPGTILHNKFLVGDCIGEGGFGITYIGRDLTLDMKVAIKEYYPNGYVNRNNTYSQDVTASTESRRDVFDKGKLSFLEEARRIAKFAGEPGIVGVREYFEENGTAYIIMDYLEGVNLAAYIKHYGTFAPEQIFRLMLPIVYSLQRIHEAGIIHRDISPDNIMFMSSGSFKLMDFGSARYFTNENREMSVMLKQGYAPEEQYRKNGSQGPWTDVYGLCATMYRCITGQIPADALDRLHSDVLIPPSQLGVDIPEQLENILMYGLAVFKENRCQDMVELASLIEQALSRQPVTIRQAQDEYADVRRAQEADVYYKTRTHSGVTAQPPYQSGVQQNQYAQNNYPQNYHQQYYQQQSYEPQTASKQGPNKKVIAAVVIASAVVIISTIAILVYLLAIRGAAPQNNIIPAATTVSATESGEIAPTAALTVKVPACENKSLDYAQTALEGQNLVVKTEYAYSSSVDEDCVISQSVAADTEVAEGTAVTLTVSKGPESSPYDYDQKLTVTAGSGSSYGTATLYEWKDGDWSKVTSYSCSLARNGIGAASEGSSTTPIGTHKLGVILTSQDIDTNMDVYKVTSQTGVVSDINSSYYNQIMESYQAPSTNKFDLLSNEFSYAAIFIEFNGNGFSSDGVVRGGGSAICVRGKSGSLSPTYGDVDISSSDMKDLISRLDADKHPVIELTVD